MPIKKDGAFPLAVRTNTYKHLIDNTMNYHWHNDFEFGVLLSGAIDFYINDTLIKLEKGDGYFVNSNIIHKSKQTVNNEDAVMYTFTFSSSLLSSNSNGTVYTKYVNPLLNAQIKGFKITEENHFGCKIKALLMKIYQLEPSAFGYELECLGHLNKLWLQTLLYIENYKVDLLHCNENTSYFGKLFKDFYSRTPFQYRKDRVWTENTEQNINNYDYEYWKDSGTGIMTITGDSNNGSFSCEWNHINNILFRSGKKFYSRDKTHSQIGSILLHYDVDYNPYGDSYLCVYGWMIEPLVEWYIIEHFTTYKPSGGAILLGTVNTDGGIYEVYKTTRMNQPSILGIESFHQYWSIRTSNRSSGTTNVSAHFRAWENLGLAMGKLTEVALNIEGWKSSGNVTVHTNVLSIGQCYEQ